MKKILLLVILALTDQTIKAQTVVIGTQTWTTRNLEVTTYRDGTEIPQVTDPTEWKSLATGAWCYYKNDTANGVIYGKLYNWYAVAGIWNEASKTNTNLRKKLAPEGYHIPTDNEWTTLTTSLKGLLLAGGSMKAKDTSLWKSPNTAASNSSGFTGFPGGHRNNNGTFDFIGLYGNWWSSSEYDINTTDAYGRLLGYNNGIVYRDISLKTQGFSVRCLRDSSLSNTTFDTSSLKLYPNPVISVLNVDNNLTNQPYKIVDALGKVILKGNLNEGNNSINVEHLSKGIYYLRVSDNKASKFIKE